MVFTLNELLVMANDILYEDDLPSIDVDDDIKLCGFSSMDMLILVLKIEKTGINISNMDIQSVTSIRDLYQKIEQDVGGRIII